MKARPCTGVAIRFRNRRRKASRTHPSTVDTASCASASISSPAEYDAGTERRQSQRAPRSLKWPGAIAFPEKANSSIVRPPRPRPQAKGVTSIQVPSCHAVCAGRARSAPAVQPDLRRHRRCEDYFRVQQRIKAADHRSQVSCASRIDQRGTDYRALIFDRSALALGISTYSTPLTFWSWIDVGDPGAASSENTDFTFDPGAMSSRSA